MTTNGSILDNLDCGVGKCNNSTWSEKKYYTSDGVMRDKEYKDFSRVELTEDIDRAGIDSILLIPRQAFDSSFLYDKYKTRILLMRDKLDTARIVSEDKVNGIRYVGVTPLSQEHGLRDMILPNESELYPENVVINPLSQEEIETIIQKEDNSKVAEGLRKYAVGRESYYYNSAEDKNFIREGISQSQGMSR